MTSEIQIKSLQGDYPVNFFSKISELLTSQGFLDNDYYILMDEKIHEIYSESLEKLNTFPTFLIPSNEKSKSLSKISDFVEWLISAGATKSSVILAIGGGVVQDVATFTAHIYKRGIKWEFVPTTVLSQADSCIGAKCGINVYPHKNQIGVMHSPSKVKIVSEFLHSLEEIEYISGYGEILKLSLTPPNNFYADFKHSIQSDGFSIDHILPILIRSLKAKQAIIEVDEYENDLRRILNYGHSFGHALEAITENKVSHGYGVLFGIEVANYLACEYGVLNEETKLDIRHFIADYFPVDFLTEDITSIRLLEALKTDKKVALGKINFAFLNSEGELGVYPKSINEELKKHLDKYLKNECIFITN